MRNQIQFLKYFIIVFALLVSIVKAEFEEDKLGPIESLLHQFNAAIETADSNTLSEIVHFSDANEERNFLSSPILSRLAWSSSIGTNAKVYLVVRPMNSLQGEYTFLVPYRPDVFKTATFDIVQVNSQFKIVGDHLLDEVTQSNRGSYNSAIDLIQIKLEQWEIAEGNSLAELSSSYRQGLLNRIRVLEFAEDYDLNVFGRSNNDLQDIKQRYGRVQAMRDAELRLLMLSNLQNKLSKYKDDIQKIYRDLDGGYDTIHLSIAYMPHELPDPNGAWIVSYNVSPEGHSTQVESLSGGGYSRTIATPIERIGGELLVSLRENEQVLPWVYIRAVRGYNVRLPQDGTVEFDPAKHVTAIFQCSDPGMLAQCKAFGFYRDEQSRLALYNIEPQSTQFNETNKQWQVNLAIVPGKYNIRAIQNDGLEVDMGHLDVIDDPNAVYDLSSVGDAEEK